MDAIYSTSKQKSNVWLNNSTSVLNTTHVHYIYLLLKLDIYDVKILLFLATYPCTVSGHKDDTCTATPVRNLLHGSPYRINHSYCHIKCTSRCVISYNALQLRHIKDATRCVMNHNTLQWRYIRCRLSWWLWVCFYFSPCKRYQWV